MSRIRYISMLCSDPSALARFYASSLGLTEIGRNAAGDVTMSDGAYNLTLFKLRPELGELRMEQGLHHIGIAVDNIEETVARYLKHYPRGTVVKENSDLQHGDVRIHDPECNPVTLSQRGFGLPDPELHMPRLAHIALNALDPEAIRDFYQKIFGFRELFEAHNESSKRPGYRNKHVGDGHSYIAIQAFYSREAGHEARFGMAHVGFLVPDSKAMAEKVQTFGATVKARPAHRTQSEIRMRDPEGNGCDLSGRGWEVDTGKWVRGTAA
jgi:catechol 2,3-dioxygenase-like lactoylglutathione lyase family enzyme